MPDGIDASPYLIERARALSSGAPNLTFEVGDGKALASKEASFDVVVLHTVLTHVPGPEAVLAEAQRVLRPGGWLGVCDGGFSTATSPRATSIRSRSASRRSSRDSCTTGGWSDA
jgi:arsenite methyltransferase